ncbi:fructose bisphosphate aldolase [Paractinoplanes hotanensis]|uniref:fructose-bisphosphate aldolase n=1 Tax=Paractinoplanes hotanensis TaxID=2906497 RepID=A0ABT0Y465_9ACTN|nr:fructose bisphosphate aldolase [Actinoplanes hotanensis]MCM4080842.1 fructose bisphosphate aldolase [Actinoplanes hotanensis]
MRDEQRNRIASGAGFLAALDQSGGSTPRALALYGVPESAYSGEGQMFDLMHDFRSRIMTSPAFTGERVLGAILFEQTMDRDVDGVGAPDYLWQRKRIVPFVKVDEGLADERDGVRLMKPFTRLGGLLERAVQRRVFGTKMRSFVSRADTGGIKAIVDQQFAYAREILGAGLVPILEPEVDIHSAEKPRAEELLKAAVLEHLADVDGPVMLKLSIPSVDNFYADLIGHPNVLRVVALSGGYTQAEADERLARNRGLIASFSRALVQDLRYQQSDDEFNRTLDVAVAAIGRASVGT